MPLSCLHLPKLDTVRVGLERPESTVNSFMALRHGWNAIERVTGPLRLKTGTSPILGAVLTRFDVIDSHNSSHQVSRAIPAVL